MGFHRDIKITKLERQQTTLQNANQSIATAKVDRNKKIKKCFKTTSKCFEKSQYMTKPAWVSTLETKLQASQGFLKTDNAHVYPLGTLDQNICMLKTWSLDVKNAPNHHVKFSIQTPAKGVKIKKGAIKKTKKCLQKSHWKCTHRAGVKCCNKNVIWLKIQYGGASRNAVPFL